MIERFLSWFRSILSEGTPDSAIRLIVVVASACVCLSTLEITSYFLWSHFHGKPFDLPENVADLLKSIFGIAVTGKTLQKGIEVGGDVLASRNQPPAS